MARARDRVSTGGILALAIQVRARVRARVG